MEKSKGWNILDISLSYGWNMVDLPRGYRKDTATISQGYSNPVFYMAFICFLYESCASCLS
jgi:hypothetical protein